MESDSFTEIEVMLAAWRTGTPTARDVALQLADDNRRRAARYDRPLLSIPDLTLDAKER